MATHDVIVIGGGPAGLTAAIYLARYHVRTLVVDAGASPALMIPVSYNHAGFPAGISGIGLLDRMRQQALRYGVVLVTETVTAVANGPAGFHVDAGALFEAPAILFATGVRNRRPPMDDAVHDKALASGRLRYCPICDGYELTDKRIAVVGSGEHGMREALFLRSYSRDVTLIPPASGDLDTKQLATLASAGIAVSQSPITGYHLSALGICLTTGNGIEQFDTPYPALGSIVHSTLASALGARISDTGSILVDRHQRTSIAGLYAAGDVVLGLDQISHAMGEGGVAATTIRAYMALIYPLRRE